ncbi:UDP-N-acetylmuramoyl-tripeptide--D-alanyl-D-alanine ligase [bacterium]|nr:MAG: UDP-N-acetylmuramoyl-tripeptide--D-alanyl-D-alanine ligase [bacterium]
MSRFSYKDCGKIGRTQNMTQAWTANGVSTDSRSLEAGNLFFALSGERFDGHGYVRDVFQKGAAACVVSENWFMQNGSNFSGEKFVVAGDPLLALQNLARLHRQRSEASVIAITGTNGKTTCKEMTHAVLSKNFRTVATQGNLNNEIGVPLTLLKIEQDTQAAVIEMGADKKGDIAFLCDMAQPDSGVITNIGTAHIKSFGSIEAISETKGELFDYLTADGVRFVNIGDARLRAHSKQTKGLVTFAINNEADYRAEIISLNELACARIRIHAPEGHSFDFQLEISGLHHANNALIAASIGFSLGIDEADIVSALENYRSPSNRMGIRRYNDITVLDDTYNANPESMRAALDTLMTIKRRGRAVAALSDMLELGSISTEEHAKIGDYILKKKPDALFTTGTASKIIHERAETISGNFYYEKKKEMAAELKKFIKPGDVVLIKGSRGMEMEEVVNELIS